MMIHTAYPGDTLWRFIYKFISRELKLSWAFIWRDISTTMIPALLFMIAAMKTAYPQSLADIAQHLLQWLLYFWLYIYTFCLADQIGGVKEDSINKPDRPIPAGIVSLEGAIRRWVVLVGMFLLVGGWFGVWRFTLLWLAASVLHNFLNWDKHWLTKNNVIMPLGFLAEVGPAWQLVTPLSDVAWRWLLGGAFVVCMTAAVQDFRDVAGDRVAGRKTLPLVLGQRRARLVMALIFLTIPIFIHYVLIANAPLPRVLICDSWISLMAVAIVYRLFKYESAEEDHQTYMLYTYWYCSVLASSILVL